MGIPQIDIDVEDEVRDFLHHAGDGEIGTKLLSQLNIATAASLQVAAVRCRIDRRDVEQIEPAGLRQLPTQLIADAQQSVVFVGSRAVNLALQAGIHQFEVENREFRWIGMRRDCNHQRQCGGYQERFHQSDPYGDAKILVAS